ncbi:hypothetical protein ANO14919_111420 [Xylariales sp. No.14919]|nr:hypothetical protein ANO14919_111420 [Xylariales sp. No.14919]
MPAWHKYARGHLFLSNPRATTTLLMDIPTIGLGVAIAVLGIVVVGLRFYTRYNKQAGLKWDDWLILVSLLLALATDVLVVYSNSLYPNTDDPTEADDLDVEVENGPEDIISNQFSFAATVLYFSITSTTKLSILLLYNRLFSVSAMFRRQIIILSIVVIGYGLGSTIAHTLSCVPLEYYWDRGGADPRFCFNYNIFWFATGICEALIDVLILLLPIAVVAKLQLSTKKKVAMGSVFVFGAFVIVSGLLKAVYGFDPGSRLPSFDNTLLWSTVHTGTGIICACLPVCWPVFVSLGDWLLACSNSVKPRGRSHTGRGWSRLRMGSAHKRSVSRHGTHLGTDERFRILSLDRAAMEPFEVEFEVENPVKGAATRPSRASTSMPQRRT